MIFFYAVKVTLCGSMRVVKAEQSVLLCRRKNYTENGRVKCGRKRVALGQTGLRFLENRHLVSFTGAKSAKITSS